jgi:hypothetical protein
MGKNTFIANCIYNLYDNKNSSSKIYVTQNNPSSVVNYYPIGYNSNDDIIYNYGNCDDIDEIKSLSDKLIYFINIPYNYKYLNDIEFDELLKLHFIKDINEINTNSDNNTIYMIQDDTVNDYKLNGNVCKYNNCLTIESTDNFIKFLLKTPSVNNIINVDNNYLIIVDVIYSYSNKKFLLSILSKTNCDNKSNKVNTVNNVYGKIISIQLEGTECYYVNKYNRTYTIVVEFTTNVYKLKGNKLFIC